MMKIGDFSRLTRISIRMLRFYDEHDILKPAKIDDNSGYRFYDKKQLHQASWITALRKAGCSTSMIKSILIKLHDYNEVKTLLEFQLHMLFDESGQIKEKIAFLKQAIQLMDQEAMNMKYDVQCKTIEKKLMMCKRGMIPSYDKQGLLWEGMFQEIKARKLHIEYPEGAQCRAYFYSPGYQEQETDVEVAIEVSELYEDSENLHVRWIPEVAVASVVFQGGYHQLVEVSFVLAQWINEHDYELDGADFNIYHVGVAQTNKSSDYVTEVCFPIKKIE